MHGRSQRVEAESGPPPASRASWRSPAVPENADRELPRHPQEVAHLIGELVRKSGALQTRISNGRDSPVLEAGSRVLLDQGWRDRGQPELAEGRLQDLAPLRALPVRVRPPRLLLEVDLGEVGECDRVVNERAVLLRVSFTDQRVSVQLRLTARRKLLPDPPTVASTFEHVAVTRFVLPGP